MNRWRNVQEEIEDLREEVADAFEETTPAKEFGACMILALVALHINVKEIRKTRNLNERRKLIHEFENGKRAVKKALSKLRRERKQATGHEGESQRITLSGLR